METISILLSNSLNKIGHMTYYKNIKNQKIEINIINLWIKEEYRGMGYGTKLLTKFFKIVKTIVYENVDIYVIVIELDDMTDRAHNNSIYEKFGFEYIEPIFPEMKIEKTRTEFLYFVENILRIE